MASGQRRAHLSIEDPKFVGVIIRAPTGVIYEHQYAGTRCHHEAIEGYFVPVSRAVFDREGEVVTGIGLELDTDLLRALFHDPDDPDACWACAVCELPADRIERLARLIEQLCYYGGGYTTAYFDLDRSRLDEAREAFVPVTTPDGPGVLVWNNCD